MYLSSGFRASVGGSFEAAVNVMTFFSFHSSKWGTGPDPLRPLKPTLMYQYGYLIKMQFFRNKFCTSNVSLRAPCHSIFNYPTVWPLIYEFHPRADCSPCSSFSYERSSSSQRDYKKVSDFFDTFVFLYFLLQPKKWIKLSRFLAPPRNTACWFWVDSFV